MGISTNRSSGQATTQSLQAVHLSGFTIGRAVELISENLRTAFAQGSNLAARDAMLEGSLLAGIAFANAGVTAVHAFAYPIGAEFHIPHGVSNAVLLPYVMNYNRPACLDKYSNIAAIFGISVKGPREKIAGKLIPALREFSKKCGIPSSLRELNIPESAISSMAEAAVKITRLMDNNPRPISEKEAARIYRQAYDAVID